MSRVRSMVLGAVLVGFGCRGAEPGDPGEAEDVEPAQEEEAPEELPVVDCDWLDGDNCWSDLGARSLGCAPTDPVAGVLGENMGDCVFPDGAGVSFTPAAADPVAWMSEPSRGFTLYQSDAPCAEYQSAESSFIYTAGTDSFTSEFSGDSGVWTCPDGAAYAVGSALFECDDVFERSPGLVSVWNDHRVSFYVGGLAGPGGSVMDDEWLLFSCALAPG